MPNELSPVSMVDSHLREERDIDFEALILLASTYEINVPGIIETMINNCAEGGPDLVRQNLEESGLGRSARNLRAARENLLRFL